jgi:hypothetical protein
MTARFSSTMSIKSAGFLHTPDRGRVRRFSDCLPVQQVYHTMKPASKPMGSCTTVVLPQALPDRFDRIFIKAPTRSFIYETDAGYSIAVCLAPTVSLCGSTPCVASKQLRHHPEHAVTVELLR